MNTREQTYGYSHESVLSTNKVLKNTYILLSMTLLFSAAMTWVGTIIELSRGAAIGFWILGFILLFATKFLRNSPFGIITVFGLTGCLGLSIAPTMNYYLHMVPHGQELIFTSLVSTAGIFFALSAYVVVSKKDFSFLGGFLFTGLIVGIIASIALMFFDAPLMSLGLSVMFVFIFSGYILYDTSRIINGGETSYISATVDLYLDILNIFLSLLHILAVISGDD